MLFPSDFLSAAGIPVNYLEACVSWAIAGVKRRTMQMGSGIEFSDHREYNSGDDLRYLDWNIYARHGDLLLKRFQEEQDLHVYLMLDCSRSMSFGTPPKLNLARHLVAALAYIAVWQIWIALPSLRMPTAYSPNCRLRVAKPAFCRS